VMYQGGHRTGVGVGYRRTSFSTRQCTLQHEHYKTNPSSSSQTPRVATRKLAPHPHPGAPTCSRAGTTLAAPTRPAALKDWLSHLFHTKGQLGSLAGCWLGKGRVMSSVSQK
jgi:hypothetical protein